MLWARRPWGRRREATRQLAAPFVWDAFVTPGRRLAHGAFLVPPPPPPPRQSFSGGSLLFTPLPPSPIFTFLGHLSPPHRGSQSFGTARDLAPVTPSVTRFGDRARARIRET